MANFSANAPGGKTERVSISSAAAQGNDGSLEPSISADGRFVAFRFEGTNLVSGDTNGLFDIFVHDRLSHTTERVNVSTGGSQAVGGHSWTPAISADGRFVAFATGATNLVAGDTNDLDVLVHDRQNDTTELISVDTNGGSGPAISGDGRFVAFGSIDHQIFVRDRLKAVTEVVSVDNAGTPGNGWSSLASISDDGRFVTFFSEASDLVPEDTNGLAGIFVRDLESRTTTRVSVSTAEVQGNEGAEWWPKISANGRFVAFASHASNLVAADSNGTTDVFVRDLNEGTTERVSIGSTGMQANGYSIMPAISADGRFVAFISNATDLVPGDTNGSPDVFVRDRAAMTTTRVDITSAGGQSHGGPSRSPSISGDGQLVAFASQAENLVPGDTNGTYDVFVHVSAPSVHSRNDLLVDYGVQGLWQRMNNSSWARVHRYSPFALTTGDLDGSLRDEAIVSFIGSGLWARYDNATWMKLHNASPNRFVAGDFDGNGADDLVADFRAAGIWVKNNNGGRMKLHNGTTQDLAVGDLDGNGKDELIADFGPLGLWVRYNNATWKKRHIASPRHIATGDLDGNGRDELVVDFGSLGIWARYNDATWKKLHVARSEGIATGDLDGNGQEEMIVDFGSLGLWARYNNTAWTKLHPASPKRMIATDLDNNGQLELVVDFGRPGLWVRYNNATWTKIHPSTTQALAAGGFD